MSSVKSSQTLTKQDKILQIDTPENTLVLNSSQFTMRSALIGSILGSVISASNMYLGLKSGWVFPASIFGAIIGYSILKPLSRLSIPYIGGYFGIKENCTVQTSAVAAGGLFAGFISSVPAMFRLNLLPELDKCWMMFFLWTLAAGFYGLFFAIPMRKYFVIHQQLPFPSPTASAVAIKSLHSNNNDIESKLQTKWIFGSFIGATIYKTLSYFIPVLVDMHIINWISKVTGSQLLNIIDPIWRWHLQIATAFLGAGMMIGTNTAVSFFIGNILAWGVIGPVLFYGSGSDVSKISPWGFDIDKPTVQSWCLWVGIVIMFSNSIAELLTQYKSLWTGLVDVFFSLWNFTAKFLPFKNMRHIKSQSLNSVSDEEQVDSWMWISGTIASLTLTILVLTYYFQMSVYSSLLAAFLGFIFSFVGCQSSGETDVNPTGTIAKASQLCLVGIPASNLQVHQLNNMISGTLAAACSAQTVDMVGDLKTGHLLGASPKSQFYAQIVGSIFGVVIAVVLFMLFAKAYPCILMPDDSVTQCEFQVPGAIAWTGVTLALTSDISKAIPNSCRIACLIFSLLTMLTVILKNTYLKSYKRYLPNWNAVGLAFVNPAPYMGIANLIGTLISILWSKCYPNYWKIIGVALASGLIAGEGIGGVLHAIFNLSGINQKLVSWRIGCDLC